MPKDSHLLPPWSQALLRAARMGQVFRPPAAPVEEDKDPGEDEDAEGDVESGFVATKWGVVPRHLEGPEPEFLAKRRKGLASLYGGAPGAVVGSGQMRKTKIRKTDGEGTAYVLEALVPEGQAVEGEVVEEDTTLSKTPAPGTVVEGVGVVNAEGLIIAGDQIQPTPPRRRPPPPKRRPKGPGRGRKKKVAFAPGAEGTLISQGVSISTSEATAPNGELKTEGDGARATTDGDVEMGEDSRLQDGEEGSEEEDEGEEGEEGDKEEGEISPSPMSVSKSPSKEPTKPEPANDQEAPASDPVTSQPTVEREPSSSPDLPLAASQGFQAPQMQAETTQIPTEAPQVQIEPPEITPSADFGSMPPVAIGATPEMAGIPTTSPISFDDAPQSIDVSIEAELPSEHDPLDGLAEPKAPTAESNSANEIVHFPDGEEDLLGSLERHLDKQG